GHPSQLGHVARRDLRERAVGGKQLARHVDRAPAAHARPELDREQLGVGERLRPVPVEALPRALGFGPPVDRHEVPYANGRAGVNAQISIRRAGRPGWHNRGPGGGAVSEDTGQTALAAKYDRVAEKYAAAFFDELERKPFDRALLDRFAAAVAGRGRVCDVGCGPGHVGRYLAARGVEVFGLDLSPRMVELARRLNPG